MKTALQIALKIAFNKQPSFSRFIIKLSIAATSLSVAAMILTVSFVNGFQEAVSNKILNLWGNIRVQHIQLDKLMMAEEAPILKNDTVTQLLQQKKEIAYIQPYATKSAVIEKKGRIEGVLFKGIDSTYHQSTIESFIKKGRRLDFKNNDGYTKEILISNYVAKSLDIKCGDSIYLYFIQANAEKSAFKRKIKVVGIYETGIEEYDKLFTIGDLSLLQRGNNWNEQQIGGYEIFVKNPEQNGAVAQSLYELLPPEWASKTAQEMLPNIFDWLNIQNTNKIVIFVIMTFVAVINLITCLLVLVLERTKVVGILKAIGANNSLVQHIFIIYAFIISVAGILSGSLIGGSLYWIQHKYHLIKLDESTYYVSYAPVMLNMQEVVLIMVTTGIICFISLILPSVYVRKISVLKSINFK